MSPHPIPRIRVAGFGRSRLIRMFRSERCSVAEIALWLGVSVSEVRRTLLRPLAGYRRPADRPRDALGRWT